jgi:ATP-binding cassette subfamily B protein
VGRFSIGAAHLLKQRLLFGALLLEPDEIRQNGVGGHLGSVLEAEAVESLALNGGLLGLFAVIELVVAAAVLSKGAGGALQALSLVGWMTIALIFAAHYFRRREQWTEARLEMTGDLIERMVGHRTRLAQMPPEHWHDGEGENLETYLQLSSRMDRSAALLIALIPRGWLILGVVGIAGAFVTGVSSPAALAISLGGILLAFRAFEQLAAGLWHVAGAAIAWKKVSVLYKAAQRPLANGWPTLVPLQLDRRPRTPHGQTVLEALEISYGYRDRSDPVLRSCTVSIRAGDKILLRGSSGSGKSTLASLLVGLRVPKSGLLLLDGFDLPTVGFDGWRRAVVAAPQFHENYILTQTFAFNLLMGRRWPPEQEDLDEAESLCQELGLGELVNRMPAGLLQMIGETGWQLSHGERSRLYIARALLQHADIIVLDESFAALDPENLRQCLTCVLNKSATLLVIAHP